VKSPCWKTAGRYLKKNSNRAPSGFAITWVKLRERRGWCVASAASSINTRGGLFVEALAESFQFPDS
jgi:hypothetical protein